MLSVIKKHLNLLLFLGLLIFGIYSFIIYLGVPAHTSSAISAEMSKSITQGCTETNYLCRGLVAFIPFLFGSIGKIFIFFWYILLSFLIYGVFLEWYYLKKNNLDIKINVRPYYILVGFFVALWLLFTFVGLSLDKSDISRVVLNPKLGDKNLLTPYQFQRLDTNLSSLKERGCLVPDVTGENGFSFGCLQSGFFIFVIPEALIIIFLIYEFLILGRQIWQWLKIQSDNLLLEFVFSSGLGIGVLIIILWIGAIIGVLNSTFAFILFLLIPIVLYRQSIYWAKVLFTSQWPVRITWKNWQLFICWALISYLALNFLQILHPYPIGWDDARTYLNNPLQMATSGHFMPLISRFQWEFLTAIGYLLFGATSSYGVITAMLTTWLAGVLCLIYMIAFVKYFLGKGAGLLSGLLYYTIPMIGFISFEDMKLDNSVLAMSILAIFALFVYLYEGAATQKVVKDMKWLILSGLFLGLSLSFKQTTVVVIIALAIVLAWQKLGRYALVGILGFITLALTSGLHNYINPDLAKLTGIPPIVSVIILLAVAVFYSFVFITKKNLRPAFLEILILFLSLIISVLPWMIHNSILAKQISLTYLFQAPDNQSLLLSAPEQKIMTQTATIRTLPDNLKLDPNNVACIASGQKEEVGRYQGSISSPWDYLLLPIKTLFNLNQAGYYVTLTWAFILFPFILLLKYFWSKESAWIRGLTILTSLIVIQWGFLMRGVPWYGIGMLLGLCVVLEVLVSKAPDRRTKILATILVTSSIVMNISMRVGEFNFEKSMFVSEMTEASTELAQSLTYVEHYNIASKITDLRKTHPDAPYTYLIGTTLPYFIPNSIQVVAASDAQLDQFNCLYQEHNAQLTLDRLRALGYNSMIVDTNLATIEQNPNGTLHKKARLLNDFLIDKSINLKIDTWNQNAGVGFVILVNPS